MERRESDARLFDELRAIQERCGFLPADELRALSLRTLTPLHRLKGLASFFPHFRRDPAPVREVRICADIVCQRRLPGALALARQAAETGTEVSSCSCLGQCDRPVAVFVDGRSVAGLDRAGVCRTVREGAAAETPLG